MLNFIAMLCYIDMKKIILLTILLFLGSKGFAQLEFSSFTATGRGGVGTTFVSDYQALGINPANLGVVRSFRDPFITFGFSEYSLNFNADAIKRRYMMDAISETVTGRADPGLSYAEKIEAGRRMANTDISVNADFMPVGIGIHLPGNQGVAFSIRNHVQIYANFNAATTDLMFMGANSSYFEELKLSNGSSIQNPRHPNYTGPILNEAEYEALASQVEAGTIVNPEDYVPMNQFMAGSRISATWWSEYNIGYGKRLFDSYNFSLYGGLDLKIIRGTLMLDLDVAKDSTFTNNYFGLARGLVIEQDDMLNFNPNVRPSDLLFPKDVSKGTGYTIGFTAVVKRNLYIGASLSNWRGPLGKAIPQLGQILSSDKLYAAQPDSLKQFSGQGFNSYNILATQEKAFGFAGESSPFDWQRIQAQRVDLPATLRVGASYEFFRTLHIGADIIIPLNQALGNPNGPFFALGGDLRLSRLIRVSSGFNTTMNAGSNKIEDASLFRRPNIPLGITYTALRGNYEAGIATKDILTYIGNFDGSTVSFASGFLRFKIGALKKYKE
jgi:hypothetical protein